MKMNTIVVRIGRETVVHEAPGLGLRPSTAGATDFHSFGGSLLLEELHHAAVPRSRSEGAPGLAPKPLLL